MKDQPSNPSWTPPSSRSDVLKARNSISWDLKSIPVPACSKAEDLLWLAAWLIEDYEQELQVAKKRIEVMQHRDGVRDKALRQYFEPKADA